MEALRAAGEERRVELLATVLASPRNGARQSARRLLASAGLASIARASASELTSLGGLSQAQAERLVAALRLGLELAQVREPPPPSLSNAERVFRLLLPELAALECETFHVLVLDSKHRLKLRECVSQGTLSTALVHPRELYRPAIRHSAAAVIAVHNHPSGDPEPSAEDLAVTRRLIEAGRLLGVPLLDHIVIAARGYVSLRERLAF